MWDRTDDRVTASFNIHSTFIQHQRLTFINHESAQVGGFSPEVEEGGRRERDDINLRLSHPAPTIWEDREIETGLRSVGPTPMPYDKVASASVEENFQTNILLKIHSYFYGPLIAPP